MKGLRCVEKQRHTQMSVLRLQISLRDTLEFNFLLISTNFSWFNACCPPPWCFSDLRNEATGSIHKMSFLFPLKIMCLVLNYYKNSNYIKFVDLNVPEHRQPELNLQCYLSPSSFFKATEASVSLVYPTLFVQEHQMSEDWSNAFLNGVRLKQIIAGFKWKRPLRSLLFPLQIQICYLQIHSFQPLCELLGLVLDNQIVYFFQGSTTL